jgi:hypothetical protein
MDDEQQVRGALVKGLVALVGIAAAIALGTFLMVQALGLDEGTESDPAGAAGSSSDPLPTTALPVPGQEEESESASPSESESASPRTPLQLEVSPQQVAASERINLTGRYQGGDNAELQVQRFEAGSWVDFPVTASVTAGSFQTWIQTSRTGEQRLRMFDPASQTASNEVSVRVG